jgi:hypothetical protein
MSPNMLYFLDCTRNRIAPSPIIDIDAERALAKSLGLLSPEGIVTEQALTVLDDFETFLVKTKKKVTTDVLGDDFLQQIKTYRDIFPTGLLPTGEVARQNIEELKIKFIWFFKAYPNFDWPLIHEATNYYKFIKLKDNLKFMATSSYFIQKTDPKTKTVKSTLADYCQLLQDDPDIVFKEQPFNP